MPFHFPTKKECIRSEILLKGSIYSYLQLGYLFLLGFNTLDFSQIIQHSPDTIAPYDYCKHETNSTAYADKPWHQTTIRCFSPLDEREKLAPITKVGLNHAGVWF